MLGGGGGEAYAFMFFRCYLNSFHSLIAFISNIVITLLFTLTLVFTLIFIYIYLSFTCAIV
jgi:hypothetical protein